MNEEELIERAYRYVTNKTYPDGISTNEKRIIRRKAEKIAVRDGEIFYRKKKGNATVEVRFIRSYDEKQKILQACHRDPTSGHLALKRTLSRISERFMWNGMVKDINNLIKHCDACQRMNRKAAIERPALHPIPVKSPWYHVGVDFVGPLPLSPSNNAYILTLSDYFTKWVEAVPAPNKCAGTVADILFKIFMRMGLPKVITTDQGREFVNEINSGIMEKFGIQHRLTTPYHPQSNGLDERWNQTLQNMLVKVVDEKKEQWDTHVDACVFAYNTSRHASTKFTPFELMFSRRANLPIDLEINSKTAEELLTDFNNAPDTSDNETDRSIDARRNMLEEAKENIKQAQERQKIQYDKKHARSEAFQCGTNVLRKDILRRKRKGGKLDYKWEGPYKITKILGKGLYSLEHVRNPKKTVSRVNGIFLKKFNTPPRPSPSISPSPRLICTPPRNRLNDIDNTSTQRSPYSTASTPSPRHCQQFNLPTTANNVRSPSSLGSCCSVRSVSPSQLSSRSQSPLPELLGLMSPCLSPLASATDEMDHMTKVIESFPDTWNEDMKAYVNEAFNVMEAIQQSLQTTDHLKAIEELEEKLKQVDLQLSTPETPGDGNCQFHALAYQADHFLHWTGTTHTEMRNAVSEFLQEHKANWQEIVQHDLLDIDLSWDEYIRHLKEPGVWGDQISLTAAAWMLQCNIMLISATMTRQISPPSKTELPTIHLGYITGKHYVSVEQSPISKRHNLRKFPLKKRFSENWVTDESMAQQSKKRQKADKITKEDVMEQLDGMKKRLLQIMQGKIEEGRVRHEEFLENPERVKARDRDLRGFGDDVIEEEALEYLCQETTNMSYMTYADPKAPYTSVTVSCIYGLPKEAAAMHEYCRGDTLNTCDYFQFVADKEAIVYLAQRKYQIGYAEANKRCQCTEFNIRNAFKAYKDGRFHIY